MGKEKEKIKTGLLERARINLHCMVFFFFKMSFQMLMCLAFTATAVFPLDFQKHLMSC